MNNFGRKRVCFFCRKKINEISYRDTNTLRRFLGIWSKIKSAKDTGACTKHQRQLTLAIKRARFMAMLPYSSR